MGLFSRKKKRTVLVCDGDADALEAVCKTLKQAKYKIVGKAASKEDGLEKWTRKQPQITLIGAPLASEADGIALLRAIRQEAPDAVVLYMGRFANSAAGKGLVVEIIRAGAKDIIAKTDAGEVPADILCKKMQEAAASLDP